MALTLTCPICGKRNGYEFRYGGEEKGPRPEEDGLDKRSWCEYVHMNSCKVGVVQEWWCHRDGCGSWFTIFRDTARNIEMESAEGEK